jgi:hypothetical protein
MARESTIGSTFRLESLPRVTGLGITAVTKSATAGANTSITSTAVVKKGDFIAIAGTGWSSLDRKTAHRVATAPVAGVFQINTDTFAETTAAPATGTVTILATQEVCLAEFGVDAGTPGEVDVTTMCDLERRNVAGLSSPGTASFGGPLDLADAGQVKLLAAFNDGLPRNLIWLTRGGQTGILYGVVSAFSGGPQGVEAAVSFAGSFQIQAAPIYLPPLA